MMPDAADMAAKSLPDHMTFTTTATGRPEYE
jgi:hypothetical protein